MKQVTSLIGYINHIQEAAPLRNLPKPLKLMLLTLMIPLGLLACVMLAAGS